MSEKIQKSRKKKRKKSILKSRFYQVYFALVALALVLIVIGTVWLMGTLRDYESAQPVYVAEEVAKLFEAGDYDIIYTLDDSAKQFESEEDKAFYVQSMHDIADGRLVGWQEAQFASTETEKQYTVTLDGERFASFTLVPSGLTTSRGRTLWTLGSITTNVTLEESPGEAEPEAPADAVEGEPEPEAPEGYAIKITAPSTYTVTVDGVNLDHANSNAVDTAMFPEDFLPPTVQSPILTEYTYMAGSQAPEVLVTDASGASIPVSQGEDGAWTCALQENTEFKNQYSDAALGLAKRIARFTSRDAGKDGILSVCAKDSPARNVFNNLSNTYATPHSDLAFQNEAVSDFYVLSDDCFVCRVSFDYLLKTSNGVKTDPTAYTFCIIRQGNSGKLYNLMMK